MKDLKSTFIGILKALYRPVVIPFFLLILFLLLNQFIVIDNLFKEKVGLELEAHHNKLDDLFFDIEEKLKQVIEPFFKSQYALLKESNDSGETPFSEPFISELKNKIVKLDLEGLSLKADDVNIYRIDPSGVIYETDRPVDMGLDLSQFDYVWKDLLVLPPGQAVFTSFDYEKQTDQMRFYAYLKLPDQHLFELGINLSALDTVILDYTHEMLKSFDGNLAVYHLYNREETHLLAGSPLTEKQDRFLRQSTQEDRVLFRYHGLFNKTVYYSWNHGQLQYGLVITIFEIYGIIILSIFLFTLFLIYFNYSRAKGIIMKLSDKLIKPILVLENKMKDFNVKTSEVDMGQCESQISEIVSMHNSFVKMSDDILASYEEMASMNEELEASYSENEELIEKIERLLETPQTFYSTHDSQEMLCQLFKVMLPMLNKTDFGLVSVIRDQQLHFIESSGIDLETINSMTIPATKHLNMDKILFKTYEEGEFHEKLAPSEQTADMEKMTLSIAQSLIIPVTSKNKFYGYIAFYNLKDSPDKLTYEDYRIAEFYSHYLKAFLMIRELSELEQDIQKETIFSVIKLLEQHDQYTKGHSENVAKLASEFAAFLELPEKTVQDIYWAGLIHDMGKILIPHTILNKPAKLTEGEFEEIKKHPVYAFDVFKDSQNLQNIAYYVKYHHEKYNGTGYPEGLNGDQIPYESRILCIADSWDAMRANRVYKKSLNAQDALNEFIRNKGVQFDPALVDQWVAFIKHHSDE